jgi:hypothetical protein
VRDWMRCPPDFVCPQRLLKGARRQTPMQVFCSRVQSRVIISELPHCYSAEF